MFELFRSQSSENLEEKMNKPKGSSERLMKSLKLFVEGAVKNVEIRGEDNLDKIPPGRKVVVVTTHISDLDLPLAAYAVGGKLDMAVTTDSFQHHMTQNPISNIGFRIAGKDNFLPIQYDKATGRGQFRPENFNIMNEKLDEGKAIVMAGHAPSVEKDPEKVAWHLPQEGTVGAIYLAELSGALLLPVAVNIKSEKPSGMGADSIARGISNIIQTMKGKPDAEIIIGEPMELEPVEGIEQFGTLLEDKSIQGRREKFSHIRGELEAVSNQVMARFASMLPETKRGSWALEEDEQA